MKEIPNAIWIDVRHMALQIIVLLYSAIAPAVLIFLGSTIIYPISPAEAFGISVIIMGIILAVNKALSAIAITDTNK